MSTPLPTTARLAVLTALAALVSPTSTQAGQFKFATQTLTVPDGFTIELVAGPPMVDRPISIAFDEQGRLYATDSSGLSDKADKQFEQKPHRIVRLEDTDGDGRFDRSVVFADAMMFPQGALFYEGSLYVAAPPHIWKLTDIDGDGVADRREVWWDGGTLTGCANDVHGPYLGPDGWFYWTKGAFAEQRHTLGNGKSFVTRAAHIFRSRPDGSGFEPVLTGGMDNPVGVAFSSTGERFLSGTFFQLGVAGKRDGLIHAIYGGVYGRDNPATGGHPRTGDLMPIMTHMGAAAPCGSTVYRSTVFGRDYAENLFVCYFNLRKISRHVLVPDGATFRTIDTDFVTSDSPDFRPTDVLEDADGSLLIVDTGGWYKICCPTSQLSKPDVLGGIYRIRKTGASKTNDPRGLHVPWKTLPPSGLAALLADDRRYVHERATLLLGKSGAGALPALRSVLTQSPSSLARRNAVWALARIEGAEARSVVRLALDDVDPSVVHTALQAVSLWRDAAALDRVVALLLGKEPALSRLAAEALGRLGDPRAIAPLVSVAQRLPETKSSGVGSPANPVDHVREHSLIYALIEIDHPDELQVLLNSTSAPSGTRAVLVALDQMEHGGLEAKPVIDRLESPTPLQVRQTARWIAGHHADWGDALADHLGRRLRAISARETERDDATELQMLLAQLAKAPAVQGLLAAIVGDSSTSTEARLVSLRTMASVGLRETPASWLAAIASALAGPDLTLRQAAIAATRTLPLPKKGHAELDAALIAVGRDPTAPPELRIGALAAASPAAWSPVDPEVFDFLRAEIDGRQAVTIRGTAATVLARAQLSPSQQLTLADTMKTVGALEAPKLLPAFEKHPNEALGAALLAALKQSPGLPGIRASTLKALLAKYPASIQQQGDDVLARVNSDLAQQNAHVDHLLAELGNGDIRRGQSVFNSDRIACTLCHVIGYRGGRLGPDLTNIGKIRSERELLQSIVFPSAVFVRGFEPFVVKTRTGETHSGLLRKDAADEVVLATGPETEQVIARSDIVDLQPGMVSPMPPGMEAVLTKQELADLVAFLKSRQ